MCADRSILLPYRFTSLTALVSVFVGSLVLLGWAFDIGALKSVLPIWVSMKANTALCFILAGSALLLTVRPPAALNPKLLTLAVRLLSLLSGLIGLLTLSEYVFDSDLGIDQWLFVESVGTAATSHPGRMAPETALNFVLLSAALSFRGQGKSLAVVLMPVIIGLLMAVFALAAILSHAMPTLGAYGWFGFTDMPIHTAILFMMLGIALIAISWQPDVLSWALGRRTTAAFACGMVLLVFIGLSTNRSDFALRETEHKILQIEQMQGDIGKILVEVLDAQSHQRNYLITGDERYLDAYLLARKDCEIKLDALQRMEIDITKHIHQSHFARIDAQVKAQFQWFQKVIDVSLTGITAADRDDMISHGEDLLDRFRFDLNQVELEHDQLIGQLKRDFERVSRTSYLVTFTGTLISLIIFIIVVFSLNFTVNERRKKERAMQESEEKFRRITESAQDAIIMMTPDQCISFWNAAAERMFGYAAAEATGRELHALIVPAAAHAKFSHAFPHFLQSGEGALIGKVTEVTALRRGGEEFMVELSIAAVKLQEQWHAISIVRDITARKKTEHKLAEQLDYLERFQKVAVKREFRIREMADELASLKAEIAGLKRRT